MYEGIQGVYRGIQEVYRDIHWYTRVLLGIIIEYPGDYMCTNMNYMPMSSLR